ncbi:hypothetical protein K501DRAFT_273975 [Backusella circina FSU 941]|nr:hypothetical protein K501DRAFT_273975 [Backusella circina FSU 941]
MLLMCIATSYYFSLVKRASSQNVLSTMRIYLKKLIKPKVFCFFWRKLNMLGLFFSLLVEEGYSCSSHLKKYIDTHRDLDLPFFLEERSDVDTENTKSRNKKQRAENRKTELYSFFINNHNFVILGKNIFKRAACMNQALYLESHAKEIKTIVMVNMTKESWWIYQIQMID